MPSIEPIVFNSEEPNKAPSMVVAIVDMAGAIKELTQIVKELCEKIEKIENRYNNPIVINPNPTQWTSTTSQYPYTLPGGTTTASLYYNSPAYTSGYLQTAINSIDVVLDSAPAAEAGVAGVDYEPEFDTDDPDISDYTLKYIYEEYDASLKNINTKLDKYLSYGIDDTDWTTFPPEKKDSIC